MTRFDHRNTCPGSGGGAFGPIIAPVLASTLDIYAIAMDKLADESHRRDRETVASVGEDAVESPATTRLRSEALSAKAAASRLREPIVRGSEGSNLGTIGSWCTKLLGT